MNISARDAVGCRVGQAMLWVATTVALVQGAGQLAALSQQRSLLALWHDPDAQRRYALGDVPYRLAARG